MSFSRSIAVAAALVLAGVTVPAHAAAEPDQAVILSCTGGLITGQFDPALSFSPQDLRITGQGQLTGCVSPVDPTVPATIPLTLTGSGRGGCLSGGYNGGGTIEFTLGAGRGSTLRWTASINLGPHTYNGVVTRGWGQGSQGVIHAHSDFSVSSCVTGYSTSKVFVDSVLVTGAPMT
ncbi:hypothetical protein ACIBG8_46490 [Nonomuraea sp. NPDC050556]|uniref:hypothetical protein n=1 Tax=Nonomuraea sp. NPDC050556 TaxID=3364369 RepID=UPI0037BC0725